MGLAGAREATWLTVGNPDTTHVYQALIQPMLTARCGACHNTERKKGGLVLTAAAGLQAGGRQGKVVVPGRADQSEIIVRLSLPPGHTDAMPPDRPIPNAELLLMRWWIDQGASLEVTLGDISRPSAVRPTLAAYGLEDLPAGIFALDPPVADSASLAQAGASGLALQRLGVSTEYLSVDATSVGPGWDRGRLALLRPIATSIAWLNLSNTTTDDSSLAVLESMSRLTRLHLAHTRVTDAGLQHLGRMPYLEYLNLVGTAVGDEGLRALEHLSRLRAVYLWGTRVTDSGVERLHRALPRATVQLGAPLRSDPPARLASGAPRAR